MKITAIIPAAGSGSRYSATRHKLLEELNGISVLERTLRTISEVEEITEVIVCTSSPEILEIVKEYKIAPGGKTRQESVFNGLKIADNPDIVLIHDGARPLITKEIIITAIKTAVEKGSAVVAVPAKDTIKKVDANTGKITETPERKELWNVQTPQIFRYKEILEAHNRFKDEDFTDDSMLMEKSGYSVYVVQGDYKNIKITTEEDLKFAQMIV